MENNNISFDHTPRTYNERASFDISAIEKVYIGAGECCRCGCGGDYHYMKDYATHAEVRAVFDSVLKVLQSSDVEVLRQDGYIFEVVLDNSIDRVACFYLFQD